MAMPSDDNIDRELRSLINKANKNGDCIINVGNGYYRPIPGNAIEEMELKEYIGRNDAKGIDIILKNICMREAFETKRREIMYAKQQAEGETGRT